MILIDINGAGASIRHQDILTCGTVGAVCEFRFDATWDRLTKTAVFRQGDTVRDAVCVDGTAKIPWETLHIVGSPLEVGVYGASSDGSVVIPTVWAKTRPLLPGADPSGDPSVDPTPGVWEQMAAAVDSKVDKVSGVEGNVVIFGEDGAVKDSGHAPTAVYTLYYDTAGPAQHNEKNRETFSLIEEAKSKNKPYVVYIDYDGYIYPATIMGEIVRAFFETGVGYVEIKKIGTRINYKQVDNYSDTFSESGTMPATQKATAEWVKSYVGEKLLIDTEVVL